MTILLSVLVDDQYVGLATGVETHPPIPVMHREKRAVACK
jgi:hypothetical protein